MWTLYIKSLLPRFSHMRVLACEAFDLANDGPELNQQAAAILAKAGYALSGLLLDNAILTNVPVEGSKEVH